uniref:Uncharacterized protein n=1 Tax=Panagrellus redivivus TaxID=6233 RepID=A0A7E4VQC0_PANRE
MSISRFTYDWLIRFVELSGSEKQKSNFKNISPMWTNLVNKYNKTVFCEEARLAPNRNIYLHDCVYDNNSGNKTVIPSSNLELHGSLGGESIKVFSLFHITKLNKLRCVGVIFTRDQLLQILSGGHRYVAITWCWVSEPVKFSEIWGFLRASIKVELEVDGLIFDGGIDRVFYRDPSHNRREVTLHNAEPNKVFEINYYKSCATVKVKDKLEKTSSGSCRSEQCVLLVEKMDAIRPSRLGSELDKIDWIWVSSLIATFFAVVFVSAIGASVLVGCFGSKPKPKAETKTSADTSDKKKKKKAEEGTKDETKSNMKSAATKPSVDSQEKLDEKPQKSSDNLSKEKDKPPPNSRPSQESTPLPTSGPESGDKYSKEKSQVLKIGSKDVIVEPEKEEEGKKKKKKHKKDKKRKNQLGLINEFGQKPKEESTPKKTSSENVTDGNKKLTTSKDDIGGVEKGTITVEPETKKEKKKTEKSVTKTNASDYKSAKTNVEKTEDASQFKTVKA